MRKLSLSRRFTAAALLACLLGMSGATPRAALAAGGAEATEFGVIAGRITDRHGAAQAGVPVSILTPGGRVVARSTTQSTGRFSVPRLKPGIYSAEVVSPTFLPFLKTAIAVKAGGLALLDISLYKLVESVEFTSPESIEQATENWMWVLRAQHPTRPVLRFQQETAQAPRPGNNSESDPRERVLSGTVRLTAGDEAAGFGQDSGLRTSFDVSYDLTHNQSLGLTGSAGFKQGTPAASLRAAWDHQQGDHQTTRVSATVRQLFLPREYWVSQFGPDTPSGARVQSVTLAYSQERQLTRNVTAEFGSLIDSFSLQGRTHQVSPHGRVVYVLPSRGLLTFSYAGVGPRALPSSGDSQKQPHKQNAEQWLAIPQISADRDGRPVLESGRHAEARWEQAWGERAAGALRTEGAIFFDSLDDAALTLAFRGNAGIPDGLLRDPFSNRHFLSAGDYRSAGARAAISAQVAERLAVVAAYSYAGTILATEDAPLIAHAREIQQALQMRRGHSLALKVDSVLPGSRTRVITSYRWLPDRAVTVADPYDRGIGQADPFLSVYVLQPLPSPGVIPGQFEAVADFSNLLAEGYFPVRFASGSHGFLFPAARSFRGGFNFVF